MTTTRAQLGQALAQVLTQTGRIAHSDLTATTPLITSGAIDSVSLFGLALWVEETIGAPVDIAQLTLPAQWDTMDRILDYIEERRSSAPAP